MAKTIGSVIKTGKNIFDHLDSKVNFTIPENLVSYQGINGKQNDKNLQLNQDNFRLQIGKMNKNGETIYTKEVLLPAIEYILKKTGKDQKAVIQLRPDLAKFLANEDPKEKSKQILSFEDEKQRIIQLIKKYFKKNLKNIEIINVSKQYPEIFSLLKEKGKDGLLSTEKPILVKDKFSALNIAKYLYRISQNNTKLLQLFYNTKTDQQKKADTSPIGQNQSDYYSLVEVAIRLYEVVSGISIQGGIDRQTKYDTIIGGILQRKDVASFKIKDYPELEELHKYCKEINPESIFERLRISTKDAEKTGEKIQNLSKFKAISLISSIALASILAGGIGGYQVSQHKQKKEKERQEEKLSYEDLDKTDISFWGLSTKYSPGENMEKKQEYFRGLATSLFNQFKEVYGAPEDKEEDIISVIKNELLRIYDTYELSDGEKKESRNIERFYHAPIDRSIIYMKDFLLEKLVPNNKLTLNQLGCNLIPYNRFLSYKSDFEKTLSIKGEIEVNVDALNHSSKFNSTGLILERDVFSFGYVNYSSRYKFQKIGVYYDYKSYKYYHFIKVKTEDGESIVLAHKSISFDTQYDKNLVYSLADAKEGIENINKYWNN